MQIVTQAELSNKMPSYQGKVRDLYDLGDQLLIISTDRYTSQRSCLEQYVRVLV